MQQIQNTKIMLKKIETISSQCLLELKGPSLKHCTGTIVEKLIK